jgi:hypothetical protein
MIMGATTPGEIPMPDQVKTAPGLSRRAFFIKTGLGFLGIGAAGCSPAASNAAFNACVSLPDSLYEVTLSDTQREILANGIPSHYVGTFPNEGCPMAIHAVSAHYLIPLAPQENSTMSPLNGWLFGIATSGVPFDPTGPFWSTTQGNIWQFEVLSAVARPFLGLDGNNAHVQPNGEYHYHGLPHALIASLLKDSVGKIPVQLGWAADGFPIYGPWGYSDPSDASSQVVLMRPSYRLLKGRRPWGAPDGNFDGTFVQDYEFVPGFGDLDGCNGRFGVVPGFPGGTYHYYVTESFPFISRFYRGTPDKTFAHPLPGLDAVPPSLQNVGR